MLTLDLFGRASIVYPLLFSHIGGVPSKKGM